LLTFSIFITERVTYSFYAPTPFPPQSVTPVPIVEHLRLQGSHALELYGENFSTQLTVFLGSIPAKTAYRCEEFILADPPPYNFVKRTLGLGSGPIEVPVILARSDGVIYGTGKTFTYQPEPVSYG
jgi:hypothetical protein